MTCESTTRNCQFDMIIRRSPQDRGTQRAFLTSSLGWTPEPPQAGEARRIHPRLEMHVEYYQPVQGYQYAPPCGYPYQQPGPPYRQPGPPYRQPGPPYQTYAPQNGYHVRPVTRISYQPHPFQPMYTSGCMRQDAYAPQNGSYPHPEGVFVQYHAPNTFGNRTVSISSVESCHEPDCSSPRTTSTGSVSSSTSPSSEDPVTWVPPPSTYGCLTPSESPTPSTYGSPTPATYRSPTPSTHACPSESPGPEAHGSPPFSTYRQSSRPSTSPYTKNDTRSTMISVMAQRMKGNRGHVRRQIAPVGVRLVDTSQGRSSPPVDETTALSEIPKRFADFEFMYIPASVLLCPNDSETPEQVWNRVYRGHPPESWASALARCQSSATVDSLSSRLADMDSKGDDFQDKITISCNGFEPPLLACIPPKSSLDDGASL